MIKFQNVSGLGVFGAEWTVESGTKMQLVNSQGTASLNFGVKRESGGQWTHTTVTRPERFGLTAPPKNWREFAVIVRAFLEAGEQE